MLKWILGILIVIGVGGAAWWWMNRPLVIRHPSFGMDCTQLVSESNLNRQVDCVRVWYGTNRTLDTGDATLTADTTSIAETATPFPTASCIPRISTTSSWPDAVSQSIVGRSERSASCVPAA